MSEPHMLIEGVGPLWCSNLRRRKDGSISFYVINGDWRGTILNGTVHVNATGMNFPGCSIVWTGRCPVAPHKYDGAIEWIRARLGENE